MKIMDAIKFPPISPKIKQYVKDFEVKWLRCGDAVFMVFAIILAVLTAVFVGGSCPWWIHAMGIFAGIMTAIKLFFANVDIENPMVRTGWGAVEYAVFISLCSWLRFHDDKTGMDVYCLALVGAALVCILCYAFIIPPVSRWLRFTREEGFNGWFCGLLVYTVIIGVTVFVESKKKYDALLTQEPYVKVKAWEKEIHNGNTYYILKCDKGTFAVKVAEYPNVRNINANTQIRVLCKPFAKGRGAAGTDSYDRLEIKN